MKKVVLIGIVAVLLLATTVIAKNVPQGKPFQELWNMITGMQTQINDLQDQINELTGRVAELEGQIPSDGTPCDDGNLCTTGDVYSSGVCIGTPVNCDDADICTIDMCDSITGSCIHYTNPDCSDNDGDTYRIIDGDCNDLNADIHPGAVEVCDSVDNDCDGEVDEGNVCCDNDEDCTGSEAPICNNPGSCQGYRKDAVCIDHTCSIKQVDDDSACGPGVEANDCGPYPSIYCNGQVDQTAPICPSSCVIDDDCDPGYHCEVTSCVADLPCEPAIEVCDGIDNDCDGMIDEDEAIFMCDPIPNGYPACISGTCTINLCDSGWYDVNSIYSDGCECQEDSYEASGGDTCGAAVDIGPLVDTIPEIKLVTGNIVPSGDEDWYKFYAEDVPQGSQESFWVWIQFSSNPGGVYEYELYKTDCTNLVGSGGTYSWKEQPPDDSDESAWYFVKVYRKWGSILCTDYTIKIANTY